MTKKKKLLFELTIYVEMEMEMVMEMVKIKKKNQRFRICKNIRIDTKTYLFIHWI